MWQLSSFFLLKLSFKCGLRRELNNPEVKTLFCFCPGRFALFSYVSIWKRGAAEKKPPHTGLKSNFPHHDNCTNVWWQMLEEKGGDSGADKGVKDTVVAVVE